MRFLPFLLAGLGFNVAPPSAKDEGSLSMTTGRTVEVEDERGLAIGGHHPPRSVYEQSAAHNASQAKRRKQWRRSPRMREIHGGKRR